ncbi:hypothetical protein L596_021141 [Steinernema carpocapsae]|uniref:Uncharacterized protein n=1 Tax=Steinernema carpocapsae TaxID=34508 RepID=A0A4U5MWP6_STECR|nr:hypothetical protein L596_021141 [Steinernema carpocapsae]
MNLSLVIFGLVTTFGLSTACCSFCEHSLIDLTGQLNRCLARLSDNNLTLNGEESCAFKQVSTNDDCTMRLLEVSKVLEACLKALCKTPFTPKPQVSTTTMVTETPTTTSDPIVSQMANITLYVANCHSAYTTSDFTIAITSVNGAQMKWISSTALVSGWRPLVYYTSVDMRYHDISEATHFVIFFGVHSDGLFLDQIVANTETKRIVFKQPHVSQDCCDNENRYQWMHATYPKDCNNYIKTPGAYSFFGKVGVSNVLNLVDFEKFKNGTLGTMHQLCNYC